MKLRILNLLERNPTLILSKKMAPLKTAPMRKNRDSNPRYPFRYAGFQDRCNKPTLPFFLSLFRDCKSKPILLSAQVFCEKKYYTFFKLKYVAVTGQTLYNTLFINTLLCSPECVQPTHRLRFLCICGAYHLPLPSSFL